jgi:cell fate regulator YaaT (PSP1 superfamily)
MTSRAQDSKLIAGVRFHPTGKIYHFNASGKADLQPGDFALVETIRGKQLGEIVTVRTPQPDEDVKGLKPIKRRATGRDLALRQMWQDKENEALEIAREEARSLGLPIKMVIAEYTLDGERLTLLYSSEENPDLSKLEHRLHSELDVAIEMLKIGPRDQAKLLGGCGACGGPRCCSHFLSDFQSISIKMAKKQGVSLHPSSITGMCDRLRCCLAFEHRQYIEALKNLPPRKKHVQTPYGKGKVVDLLPLQDAVVVKIENRRMELPVDEVKRISE